MSFASITNIIPVFLAMTVGILLIEAPASSQDTKACLVRAIQDKFAGKTYEVKDASDVRKHLGSVRTSDLLGDGDHVLFTFQPSGHVALMVGDIRYDGDTFATFGKVRDGINTIRDGTVIRFKNLPSETVEELKANLRKKVGKPIWSFSCYSGACSQLSNVGINSASGDPLLPTTFFKRIFEDGFVDKQGNPITLEIYRTDDTPIQSIYDRLKLSTLDNLVPAGIIAALWSGGTVYYLFTPKPGSH